MNIMELVSPFVNSFTMYVNISTYIITFGLKPIHDIQECYTTFNKYSVFKNICHQLLSTRYIRNL